MKIAIIETGMPPEGLDEAHGTYADMFRAMLAPYFPALETTDYPVYRTGDLPDPGAADGFLITGSPAGVYEDHDWIEPLAAFIRTAIAAETPVAGICFGHQIMAHAFGGTVRKSEKGWGAGIHTYEMIETAPYMVGEALPRIACAVSHQDQVIDAPANAVRLGGSAFCPNGILSYAGGRGLSFQMHPEFTHDYALALLELRSDRIPDEVRSLARPGLAHGSDRETIARWIATFFNTGA
ncbi:type 1 glutamine amidotransferase [Aquisalinus flavus]|uniref:Glutamine amidotransferase n=1 Tax=Aquisalinus flavus TaxID=1526572 RepID=A0A8J2V3Z4_9PROT|nr:gamma-glutamyl-gamma-aminobutyrate hydrolase family protein [Aquisalinus flavus]MBD0427091.1 gamma-glutamyl-gamma-aminobutyrate hydrolase family protein [Aquisalinus flavus]UNE46914.1 type 1 glutamine amidotransferase [Aquisalinus flavus]GGC98303.1 glutamine amidotransferase [Aquisalinus flavus]